MNTHQESLFEVPASHESLGQYESAQQESEFEWEAHGSPYASPEYEASWGTQENGPYEANPYANPYAQPELEEEWEQSTNELPHMEGWGSAESAAGWSGESDSFIGNLIGAAMKVARHAAPQVARALGGLAGNVPSAVGQLVGGAIEGGEEELAQLESRLFAEASYESGASEAGQAALLAEVLAGQAAQAESESEAAAMVSATLPVTIMITGGQRALTPYVPVLAQANGVLTRLLRQQGLAGQQLLRVVPTIQRYAAIILRNIARSGKPISRALVLRALAGAARTVLANPRLLRRALRRNLSVQMQLSPQRARLNVTLSRPRAAAPQRSGPPRRPAKNTAERW